VLDDNEIAVIAGVRRGFHDAVAGRVDRLPSRRRDVDALVKTLFPGQRVAANAKPAGGATPV